MLRIGMAPVLETRDFVLWFAESKDPPAFSMEATSEFRPMLSSRDFVNQSLVSPSPEIKNLPPREFRSRELKSSLPI
jgi:hypothetical protein